MVGCYYFAYISKSIISGKLLFHIIRQDFLQNALVNFNFLISPLAWPETMENSEDMLLSCGFHEKHISRICWSFVSYVQILLIMVVGCYITIKCNWKFPVDLASFESGEG